MNRLRGDGSSNRCRRDRNRYASLLFNFDLKNDAAAISEYKRYHEKIWPEIRDSIYSSGIVDMEIYLLGTRLFMIMEVNESFTFSAKAAADAANSKVQEWESLMGRFQQPLPRSQPGQRWVLMERIFSLKEQNQA